VIADPDALAAVTEIAPPDDLVTLKVEVAAVVAERASL
jgi:hypothetical protein